MSTVTMFLNRRLKKSPYEQRAMEHGATLFSLYNKMTLPMVYGSWEKTYEHLCEHVQLWDVACQRQVEIVGPDALRLTELITPRDVSRCAVGQCLYAPLCDENGGIMNDPIILRLAEDRFWLSIADSDVCFWVKGVAYGRGFDVSVFEPDVSPLAIQGPKADDLMAEAVGEHTRDIRFFWFIDETVVGTPVKIARSGWSGQGGFEVYLQDSSKGNELWDFFWDVGQKYNVGAGAPNLIERLETGLKSYGADMTIEHNPFEASLEPYIDVDKEAEYMCRDVLVRVRDEGPARRLVKIFIEGDLLPDMRYDWPVFEHDGNQVGIVTSKAWSQKFDTNFAFAMIDAPHMVPGSTLRVDADGEIRGVVVRRDNWEAA